MDNGQFNSYLSFSLSNDIVGAIINRPLSIRTVEVLQSAANLQITMIAGGNHTDIQYAGPYLASSLRNQ